MNNNSENRIQRVLFVGGFQEQREVIFRLCNYYCTTCFEEYSGGKPSRLEMVEKNARRLLLVDGYHMASCECDQWDLILVWPDCDNATKRFLDEKPKALWTSYLDDSIEGGCYQHAINTIQQCLRISNQ